MKAPLLIAVVLTCAAVAVAAPAASTGSGGLRVTQTVLDGGEVYQFAVVEQTFEVLNPTEREIRIEAVEPGDPLGVAEPEPRVLPPGGSGRIAVRQPVGPRLGETAFSFKVRADDGATHELVLNAFVQSAYDTELPFLDFGDVERGAGKRLPLEVASREVDRVELLGVERAPEFVEVAAAGRSGVAGEVARLEVAVDPDAPPGLHVGVLHLKTSVGHHPDYLVRFRASVYGDVVPQSIPLDLGVLRVGEAFQASLRLGSRTGQPFRVGAVRDSLGWLQATAAPCRGGRGPSDCWEITLRQTPARPARLGGTLEAEVDGETLPLAYGGLVVSRDATVHELGSVGGTAPSGPGGARSPHEKGKQR